MDNERMILGPMFSFPITCTSKYTLRLERFQVDLQHLRFMSGNCKTYDSMTSES